jgi:hypothetical protein
LDALAEAGDFLDPGQEGWGDGENGLVTHGNESSISQVLCQVLVRWCVKFCHLKRFPGPFTLSFLRSLRLEIIV